MSTNWKPTIVQKFYRILLVLLIKENGAIIDRVKSCNICSSITCSSLITVKVIQNRGNESGVNATKTASEATLPDLATQSITITVAVL